MNIAITLNGSIDTDEVIEIYRANAWSSADKPLELMAALRNSHSLVTARITGKLVGLGNAISDGHLVVYFPHMLVHPDFQRRGVGQQDVGPIGDDHVIAGGGRTQQVPVLPAVPVARRVGPDDAFSM